MTFLNSPTIPEIFGPKGILALEIPGYASRPAQMEMAQAVSTLLANATREQHDAFPETSENLVIEAETGLGKTLAYLIPAILSGQRVVVSTNTRNLQDQILEREIPLIQRYIAPELHAMTIKGRQNYLCLHRWHQYQAAQSGTLLPEQDTIRLDQWVAKTSYGERAELPWIPAHSTLWQKICCVSHFCLGGNCPHTNECFLNKLRRDAAACSLLIVNHHLLFSDLAVRKTGYGEVLPRYETVIFDEAHHLESIASTYFGIHFSRYQVLDLCGDIEREAGELPHEDQDRTNANIARVDAALDRLTELFPREFGRFPLCPLPCPDPSFQETCADLHGALDHLYTSLEALSHTVSGKWIAYSERCRQLADRLLQLTGPPLLAGDLDEEGYTYWFERSERNLVLHATPVEIAEDLQQTLFSSVRHCLFTSATLATGGTFKYFFRYLGLTQDTPTLSLPSPFDYANKSLLFIPDNSFPPPGTPSYSHELHACMEKLIRYAQGRTLVLFTSHQAMEKAYHNLRDKLPFEVFIQGSAPRKTLLRQFSKQTESILFAVASFWEGVDVPGESLSLVIIDKLPFEVPSDPVIMARSNRIKSEGGNPFIEFQVPRAILTLRQGAGRLMRSANDRGVIAILDTRLYSKGYGRQFLKSLPPSPVTRDLTQVADFFNNSDADS